VAAPRGLLRVAAEVASVAAPAPPPVAPPPTPTAAPMPALLPPESANLPPAPTAAEAAAASTEKKRGPGRPRRAAPDSPIATRPAADATAPASNEETAGVELFVDVVTSVATSNLDGYVAEKLGRLCREGNVLDVRCAPKDSPLAYGGWRGLLTALVRAEPPPAGRYSIDSRGGEVAEVVIEALRTSASFFVRGSR
jgi:hypothetical protein